MFEYCDEKGEGKIESGETSLEQQNETKNKSTQQQEDEIKMLRLMLSFSYEYMTKVLQDGALSTGLRSELAKVLGLISTANSV